jgi:hypothetical protein
MQTSLVHHYDRQYTLLSILGLAPSNKSGQPEEEQENEQFNMDSVMPKNRIDINSSLSTFQRQSAHYVKIDDNVLNFHFDRAKRAADGKRDLTAAEIGKLGSELNRIHVSYLASKDVECRRKAHLAKLRLFGKQFSNLRKKGVVLEHVQDVDEMLLKRFGELKVDRQISLANKYCD